MSNKYYDERLGVWVTVCQSEQPKRKRSKPYVTLKEREAKNKERALKRAALDNKTIGTYEMCVRYGHFENEVKEPTFF